MTAMQITMHPLHAKDPGFHRARSSDPSTSKRAAIKAERFALSHAGRIVCALVNWKDMGYTSAGVDEIAAISRLTIVQIDRRLHEMQDSGLVELVMENGQPKVRNGYRVWTLKDSA